MFYEKAINFIKNILQKNITCSKESQPGKLYDLYEYFDSEGKFDYQQYKQIQIETNKSKLDQIWAKEENISFLSQYIKSKIGIPKLGICHGTRRGLEQQWFIDNLKCKVIGTEISDTAKQFKNTIQWDFHKVKDEWLDHVDFIYSNSLDHSYDPQKCLNAWTSCLNKNGLLIIEHSEDDHIARKSDPFGASIFAMPYLILNWSNGKFFIVEMIKSPYKTKFKDRVFDTHFLIIKNNI